MAAPSCLRKGADAIVVNDVTGEGIGFDADNNAATFLTTSTAIELPEMPKRELADRILDEILTLRRPELCGSGTGRGRDQNTGRIAYSTRPLRRCRAPATDCGVSSIGAIARSRNS